MSYALKLADEWEHRSYELATELRRLDALSKAQEQEINRLRVELAATQARLDASDKLLQEAFAQRQDALAALRATQPH